MNSTQPWALEAERCDRTSSSTLPPYKRNANSGLLSGTGTQREERGRTQRGQAQEAETSTPDLPFRRQPK